MRRVLLKVLLIAVFLNAAIGVPLHAAVHLTHSEAVHSPSSPDHDEGDEEQTHLSCAWCLAHAEASGAPPAALDASPVGASHASHALPATAASTRFSAGWWASSPRGPPC